MTRQLEAASEDRKARLHKSLIRSMEYGLFQAFQQNGTILTGFSVKIEEWECLMTLRAIVKEVPSVSFVVSVDLINCIVKAEREARKETLVWRADRYATT